MPDAPQGIMLADPRLVPYSIRLDGLDLLKPWEFESLDQFILRHAADIRVIVTGSAMTPSVDQLERLPNLGLLACVSTGYEGIDLDWCRARGVRVSNAGNATGDDVADQALGLLIAAYRRFTHGGSIVRTQGAWKSSPGAMRTPSLRRKRAGIIGMGNIGQAIAQRVEACGMVVSWYGPNPKPQLRQPRAETLLALAQESDALILAAPANAQTDKMINRQIIDALGPKGVVVNIGRGALIDEDELIAALREGRLMAAGLDVFEQEPTPAAKWADVPNVELMPHSAGATPESGETMMTLLGENVRGYLASGTLTSALV